MRRKRHKRPEMMNPTSPYFPHMLDPYTRKLLSLRSPPPLPPPPPPLLMFPPGVGIPNIFPPSVSPTQSHLADIPDIIGGPPSPPSPSLSQFTHHSITKHFLSPIKSGEPTRSRGDISKFSIETLMSTTKTTNQSRSIKKEPELEEEDRFSVGCLPQHPTARQQQQQHNNSVPYSFHQQHFAALKSLFPKILNKHDQ